MEDFFSTLPLDNKRTLLFGIDVGGKHDFSVKESLEELRQLCLTAGLIPIDMFIQKRDRPHTKTYLGSGKLMEAKAFIAEHDICVVVTDDELSPMQCRALEDLFQVKILDRTGVILDIFAQRAQSSEAQLQVELAQLMYILPRLRKMWTHLSRLGGGIGTRGPGETQLETDRRQVSKRISLIKKKLSGLTMQRQLRRQRRQDVPLLNAAIIGYTNAGKSTLFNRLTGSKVLAEDKLFATLDPFTRRFVLPSKHFLLLTDTVGFIRKLPHLLIDAFHATLETVTVADVLIHVVDVSAANFEASMQVSKSLIRRLQVNKRPILTVFNKVDAVSVDSTLLERLDVYKPYVLISAKNDVSFRTLFQHVDHLLDEFYVLKTFSVPFDRQDVLSVLYQHAHILEKKTQEKTLLFKVTLHRVLATKVLAMLSRCTFK
ncbi:MAG: GTPase HflX [bacterium]